MPLINTTPESFQVDVLDAKLPVLLDVWATWCGPCKALAPFIEDLAIRFDGKAQIVKVDVSEDNEVNTAFLARYEVKYFPTVLLFKDGILVDRLTLRPTPFLMSNLIRKYL